MQLETESIVGYPVCSESVTRIAAELMAHLGESRRSCRYFSCLNPHAVEMAASDPAFHAALMESDFLTADGVGVVIVSRLSGGGIRHRVTGTDVFETLTGQMNKVGGMSCFFLGSTDETLARIRARMADDYPRVKVAGTLSPPFKPAFEPADSDAMIRQVNESGADVLWVGLTAPKQEKWLHDHRDRLQVGFAGPIGAAFDFYAGNIKRAGPALQNLGLEWLPRLLQEPRRLWRRSFVSAPAFFLRSLRYRASGSGSHGAK
jgi:N-acetylglucosaminyldiphosphoundecaprenol N-acetyl-beta-D-mannosaminyltransferase